MEPGENAATAVDPREVVAGIDQKALTLSALLRDIDNHFLDRPVDLSDAIREELDRTLEMLDVRIAATRTLLREKPKTA